MSHNARLTEERLRSWLDGDQPGRERLCIHIMSLDRRFSQTVPVQPKGGPDGGRDIEARFENNRPARGAIGFRNSPSDGAADVRWVKDKFLADLDSALRTAPDLAAFVFFTNVRLTVKKKQSLLDAARKKSAVVVEIYDRERLRVVLDGVEGLAARYQFLQIPMSETEQAVFFTRWGAELESMVTTSFERVDLRLRRLEFLHEAQRPLTHLAFHIVLSQEVSHKEQPHVRALLHLSRLSGNVARNTWSLAVCNNTPLRSLPSCGHLPCLGGAYWHKDASQPLGTFASSWRDPFRLVSSRGGVQMWTDDSEISSLADLDGALFAFFMNRSLSERIARIEIFANDYLVWSAPASELGIDTPNGNPTLPWPLSSEEMADEWVRVMNRGYTASIDFSASTPVRLLEAAQIRRSQ